MMGRIRTVFILLAAAWLAAGCAEPSSREYFVKNSQRDSLGRYPFELALDDSLAVYSLRLYTRIDLMDNAFASIAEPAVDVLLVAPSGRTFSERVFLSKDAFEQYGILAKDFDMPYRTGFRPVEYGTWQMFLSVPDSIENMRGMGVKLSKEIATYNGQR